MATLVGNSLDFNNASRALNLPAPLSAGEPVRRQDLDSAIEGLAWKDSCRVATQGNLNLASPGATIDGITMVTGDRFLVKAQTNGIENGIYVWNGAAVAATRALDANTGAELEQATTSVEEGTDAQTSWRQSAVNFTIDVGSPTWASFGMATPAASTSTAGVAALATQAEVDAGLVTNKIVTPATAGGRKLKFSQNIGDGTATQFDVTHNFNTRDSVVSVARNSTPWDTILCDVSRLDTNTVRLNFAVAPSTNAFRVLVLG